MNAPIRLSREITAGRQAAAATAIGAVLTLLGGGILLVARVVAPSAPQDAWLPQIVGAGFALVGVVVLLLGLKMSLSTRLPQTIVEVDKQPVRAGQSLRVSVRQPGPISLRSLRVNLIAEQITRYEVRRQGKKRIEIDRHLIYRHNVVDLGTLVIAGGEESAASGEVSVPLAVPLVDVEGDKTVVWRLEVWGRVRGWVDFGHPFVVQVAGVRLVAAEEP